MPGTNSITHGASRKQNKVAEFVDLKVDRNLLDSKFEGYKLSLESFPTRSIAINCGVRVLQLAESQYSLQHTWLFASFNHLYPDLFLQETDDIQLFYVTGFDCSIYCIPFSIRVQDKSFSDPTLVCALPTRCIIGEAYSPSLIFPTAKIAVYADGAGLLYVFSTGERRLMHQWQDLFHCTPMKTPFKLYDAVYTQGNMGAAVLQCLLVSVADRTDVPSDSASGDETFRSHFITLLHWITLTCDEANNWSITRTRLLTTDGWIDYAALSPVHSHMACIMCTKPVQFMSDTLKPVQHMESCAEQAKEYTWGQTAEDVYAVFTVGQDVTKRNVQFELLTDHICMALLDNEGSGSGDEGKKVLLDGHLHGLVNKEASTFVLQDGRLEVTLAKQQEGLMWPELVLGDNRGEYVADPDLVQQIHGQLAHLTSDTEVTKPGYNTHDLEECDVAISDMRFLQWWDGDEHEIVKQADIGGRELLFTSRFESSLPPHICLRHDVDALLWRIEPDCLASTGHNWLHQATFLAFGYVQASKQQKKFCLCSPNASYASVIECTRHAYVYWQPQALTEGSELRNRKTGRQISKVAKQNLVTLDTQADIVGAWAGNDTLFVLTQTALHAILLRQ